MIILWRKLDIKGWLTLADQNKIHEKGFSIIGRPEIRDPYSTVEYGKIKVNLQTLDDAILDLGSLKKDNRSYGNKALIIRAMARKEYETLRAISNYFFEVSGLYERLCKYFATLYRYDWYITPYIIDEKVKDEKVLNDFA